MLAYTRRKQSAEYEHSQTFKMELFSKGKSGRRGGTVELGPFDEGAS